MFGSKRELAHMEIIPISEVNNSDHLGTKQCSARKLWVLSCYFHTYHPSKRYSRPRTPLHATATATNFI